MRADSAESQVFTACRRYRLHVSPISGSPLPDATAPEKIHGCLRQ